jgi:hypothetical protein
MQLATLPLAHRGLTEINIYQPGAPQTGCARAREAWSGSGPQFRAGRNQSRRLPCGRCCRASGRRQAGGCGNRTTPAQRHDSRCRDQQGAADKLPRQQFPPEQIAVAGGEQH